MKIKKTKLIMLVLTVFMLLGVLVFTASASDNEIITGKAGENAIYTYYPETDALVFSGEGKVDDYSVYLDEYTQPCYIIIEDGITEIGSGFFGGRCSAVYIPESVNIIDENAFNSFSLMFSVNFEGYYNETFRYPSLTIYYEGSQEQFEQITPYYLYTSSCEMNEPVCDYVLSSHKHNFSEGVFNGKYGRICGNNWYTEYICDCGLKYHSVNKPLNDYHDFDFSVPTGTLFVSPPCFEDPGAGEGYTYESFCCTYCVCEIVSPYPVAPHTFKCYEYESFEPCRLEDGEIGTTRRWSVCVSCNSRYDETEITTGRIECEPLEWTVTKNPTCIEKGEEKGLCIHCNLYVTRAIDEKPHNLRYVVSKEATCKEEGEAFYDCIIFSCPYRGETIVLPTVDHKPGEWYVSSIVSCTTDGEEARGCVWCGERLETRKTEDKLGHDFGEWVVMVSSMCIFQGWEYKECARCGIWETRDLPLTPCYDSDDDDPYCDYCGNELEHIDKNNDGICDFCTTEFEHRDYDDDGCCDWCGQEIEHRDANGDGYCDWCGYEFEHKISFFDKIVEFFNSIVNWFRRLFGLA